jgi:hypothetical protein
MTLNRYVGYAEGPDPISIFRMNGSLFLHRQLPPANCQLSKPFYRLVYPFRRSHPGNPGSGGASPHRAGDSRRVRRVDLLPKTGKKDALNGWIRF